MTAIQLVTENDDFIIVDKPADISFHNDIDKLGIASLLKQQTGIDLWPVHRLDQITSGLLIFAKHKTVAAKFSLMFENQQVSKVYLAISDKTPKKKQGLISGDLLKTRNGNWKLSTQKLNPSVTRFFSQSLIPGKRLFWVQPQTGKTHQIRVALKSLGSPILGDSRYTGSEADRGYLHAYRLNFIWNNQELEFTCLPTSGEYFLLENLPQSVSELCIKAK